VFPHHALEGFPGSAGYGVGVAQALALRNKRRDARVLGLHRIPVAEVPGLQFLDGNAVDQLPGHGAGLAARVTNPALVARASNLCFSARQSSSSRSTITNSRQSAGSHCA